MKFEEMTEEEKSKYIANHEAIRTFQKMGYYTIFPNDFEQTLEDYGDDVQDEKFKELLKKYREVQKQYKDISVAMQNYMCEGLKEKEG